MVSPGKRRASGRPTRRGQRAHGGSLGFWQQQLRRVVVPTVGIGAIAIASAAVATSPSEPSADVPNVERVTVAASEVSRGGERPVMAAETETAAHVTGTLWVVADAEIRSNSAADGAVLAHAESGSQVLVTGVVEGEWTQVLHNDLPRWIATSAVSDVEPLGTQPCATGSGVENGLQPDTIKVHRAVCAKFPQITTYGGLANRMEHNTGHALDIMVTGQLGDEIAQFLMDHAAELGVRQLIWEQQVWRPGGSWSPMADRGNPTANHFDHIDVTTHGSAAS